MDRTLPSAIAILLTPLCLGASIYYKPDAAAQLEPGATQRIEQIASMLEEQPRGLGTKASERDFWDSFADSQYGKSILQKAEALMQQPMPVLTDELFLLYTETGDRTRAQNVMFAREDRLVDFCLAECVENKGRFIKPIEEALDSSISYRTWVYPAHDGNLENFHGTRITVDLKSARDAHNYALCLYLLGDRISRSLVEKVESRVHELVLAPYVKDIFENGKSSYWKTCTHNWNPVCHAGVVGAAVTMLPDKLDRALFIERAIHYMNYYYDGFTADGYCSEGLGYWNYGFGQYIVLSETIYRATGGNIDLFANAKGLPAALYPFRIEMINGKYPALADCALNNRPQADLMGYVNIRLGLKDERWPMLTYNPGRNSLFDFLKFSRMEPDRPAIKPPFAPDHDGLRTWFSDGGVLVCRPAEDSAGSFAAVLKGGHNAEHHNHNDLGSFIVMVDDEQVILDPGSAEYTKTTFGKDRYTIKKISSYGHPVPLVAGTEQVAGRSAQAKIIRQEFTPEEDILAMDLSSAYPVEGLKKLERSFTYSRKAKGSLEVTDSFEFAEARPFQSALITYGTYRQTGPNTLEIESNGKTAMVQFNADIGTLQISDEIIKSTKGSPLRIAVGFAQPVKKGQISMKIWPK